MENNALSQTSPLIERRRLLLAGGALLLSPVLARAGAQREETLSDDVASVMRNSVNNANPARVDSYWIWVSRRRRSASSGTKRASRADISRSQRAPSAGLANTNRAGLDTQMVLGLIEVESAFRQYAISGVGARGLMQVMPFWKNHIGRAEHNLFDIRTNLRYGCTILRHYNNVERGNLTRALARFNGSLGSNKYPNAVIGAWRNRWQWAG